MEVSMNGLRANMVRSSNELAEIVQSIVDDESFDKDELVAMFDNLAQDIAMFTCVFDSDNKDFSDMSDKLEVKRLGDYD